MSLPNSTRTGHRRRIFPRIARSPPRMYQYSILTLWHALRMFICATVVCGRRGALGSLDRRTTLALIQRLSCGSAISVTLVVAFYNKHNKLKERSGTALDEFRVRNQSTTATVNVGGAGGAGDRAAPRLIGHVAMVAGCSESTNATLTPAQTWPTSQEEEIQTRRRRKTELGPTLHAPWLLSYLFDAPGSERVRRESRNAHRVHACCC